MPHVHTPSWGGKAVLFDLDGVLVDTMPIHREAFIASLAGIGVTLSEEQHDSQLAGLPTRVKLDRLGITGKRAERVEERKQLVTRLLIEQTVRPDPEKCDLFRELSRAGYALGVYSNAVHATVTRVLQLANLVWPLGVILSNEHVTRPKPAPDGWIIAMYELGAKPEHTLIVEDSPPGIASALNSGARVVAVDGPHQTVARLKEAL